MYSKNYFVYIMTGKSNRVLYTGVTSNLKKRIWEHKNKVVKGFSSRYNLYKLVYYEVFEDINEALKREKNIKAGNRKKKELLIVKNNPRWEDVFNLL